MKLLFILPEYLPESGGGIISYYAGVLPRLVAAGHSVDVLVAGMEFVNRSVLSIDGVRINYLKTEFLEKSQIGFERYRVGYPTFASFLPMAWAAYEQVHHGIGYDIIETTDFPLLFAPWIVSSDSPPVVVSLHGSCGQLDWYVHPERNSMDGDLLRLVERSALACASGVYTNSEMNARFWESASCREIPILLPIYDKEIGEQRCKITRSLRGGVVVGRFQNWKGSRVLCEALTRLSKEQVRWIGTDVVDSAAGVLHSEVLKQEFPQIIGSQLVLEGSKSRNAVLREIATASYLCAPSEWDVFNLTVIEAMAQGTPVICSDRAGASMLIGDGRNGFLFNPDSPDELAGCIGSVRGLSNEGRENMVRKALQTIVNQLDPNRLIAERIAFYQEVIASYPCWKIDVWLEHALSPREESDCRTATLRSYTTNELIKAAGGQALNGIFRHLGVRH